MNLFHKLLFVLVFIMSKIVFSLDTITVPDMMYNIDHEKRMVVTNYDVDLVNSTWTGIKSAVKMDKVFEFNSVIEDIEIGREYEITDISENQKYKLFFTELPVICINTDNKIVDEPRVLAMFSLVESNQNKLISAIGIECRGGWTQNCPKKSFRVEFLEDTTTKKTQNVSLLSMRSDDDWNLIAMYNEPLRIRNKTNFKIWKMIHTIHYKFAEPEAVNGIEMKYAELFLNGLYQGVYCVGERIDRKQLKLKKYDDQIRGELYKGISWGGACTFDTLQDYNNEKNLWGGFEYIYPEEEISWDNLYSFIDFVINADDSEFYSGCKTYFNIDNAVDYFVFLNLIRATDNMGKNVFLAKYDINQQYFFVPWDLDGTFGTIWNGSFDSTTNDLLTNGFYRRLWHDCAESGFREKLKAKWINLRDSIITHENLVKLFQDSYNYLNQNGVYQREAIVWDSCSSNFEDLEYMFLWIEKRLEHLDEKFSEDCQPIQCIAGIKRKSRYFKSYPNPVSNIIKFDFDGIDDSQVFVFDNNGRMILSDCLNNKKRHICVNKLPAGIYYIRVRNGIMNRIEKIIIQK